MYTRSNRELWLSFIAIVAITLFYAFIVAMLGGIPPAREFFGHSLGIIGFIMMLMTETLYSLRKRSRRAGWGKMASWLDFHIFTGLVGPYLVLLHSSWKFNGLAGIAMLLTVMIVISGVIGRYIYTAVPRTAEGAEIEADQLERNIAGLDTELQLLLAESPSDIRIPLQNTITQSGAKGSSMLIFGRGWDTLRFRWSWYRARRHMSGQARQRFDQLERLLQRRRTLSRQINSLAAARRLLATWHTVHIPIGMVLFTAAFIHIAAAFYYATLLR